jgi:hypothetical protein
MLPTNNLSLSDDNFAIDQAVDDKDTLYAFYDLKWMPVSFDIPYFLMSAEVARSNQGLRQIVVVFVPASVNTRWPDGVNTRWRFDHICLAHIPMFPSIAGFIVAGSRAEGFFRMTKAMHQFPDLRDPANLPFPRLAAFHYPTWVHMAKNPGKYIRPRAPPEAVATVRRQFEARLGSRRLIVITLRGSRHSPVRNSNINAWKEFAASLDPNAYFPLFIPDTENALSPDLGVWNDNCAADVAFDLQLRLALNEMAWLNLFVSNGPLTIAMLDERCRVLAFKFHVPEASESRMASLESLGLYEGKAPLHANEFQRWVWKNDDLSTIVDEFQDMARFIEANDDAGAVPS